MKHLFIFGTRPEAIKMAPLVKEFKNYKRFTCAVAVTGQHREMLDQVLDFFGIRPEYDLNLMSKDQTLHEITAKALTGLKSVIDDFRPDNIFVQGDTTSALVGALAGYYDKVSVSHIEAGLRSGNLYSPFPEEGNRLLIGKIANYHFAPTDGAVENLYNEGITTNVLKVGNSVIDALLLGLDIINARPQEEFYNYFKGIDFNKKIVLVTSHRRESFGEPFVETCNALKEIAAEFQNVQVVYPVHLNPNIKVPVHNILGNISNIHLIDPLPYPYLIWLINKSNIVLTDSGGIQEEAPTLGKPVLVLRDVTERVEGIEAGTAKLVGTNKRKIVSESVKLLTDEKYYANMANSVNPYGDGTTSKQILNIFANLKPNVSLA